MKGQQFKLTPAEITIGKVEKTVHVEEFVPNVIEPSFGVGRILYSILEHNFKIRPEDVQRTVIQYFFCLFDSIFKCAQLSFG